jgi:hypothetical protein
LAGFRGKYRFLIDSGGRSGVANRAVRRRDQRTAPQDHRRAEAMTTQTPSLRPFFAGARNAAAPGGALAGIAAFWRAFLKAAFDPYHPERHYMRGPGPACAAKRGKTG